MVAYLRGHRHAEPWQQSGLELHSASLPQLQQLPGQLTALLQRMAVELDRQTSLATPLAGPPEQAASIANRVHIEGPAQPADLQHGAQQALLMESLLEDLALEQQMVVSGLTETAAGIWQPLQPVKRSMVQAQTVTSLKLDVSLDLLETYVLYWQLQPFLSKAAIQLLFTLAGVHSTETASL